MTEVGTPTLRSSATKRNVTGCLPTVLEAFRSTKNGRTDRPSARARHVRDRPARRGNGKSHARARTRTRLRLRLLPPVSRVESVQIRTAGRKLGTERNACGSLFSSRRLARYARLAWAMMILRRRPTGRRRDGQGVAGGAGVGVPFVPPPPKLSEKLPASQVEAGNA